MQPRRTAPYSATSPMLPAPSSTLADVLRFSDVLRQPDDSDTDDAEVWHVAEIALAGACDRLAQMRAQEGHALADDLTARVDALDRMTDQVEARAPSRSTKRGLVLPTGWPR